MTVLIIPTHNRPHWFGRLLLYYRQVGLNIPIVVADSSQGEPLEKNRAFIESAGSTLRITHRTFDPSLGFSGKVLPTLADCDSEYVVFCGDDDFMPPSGIAACVEFLRTHPDYAAAHGQTVMFQFPEDAEQRTDPRKGMRCLPYRQRSIEMDDPAVRLLDHLVNYTPTFYSVQRRKVMLADLEKNAKATRDFRFGELLPSCLTVVHGKVKKLDNVVFNVRQEHKTSFNLLESSFESLLSLPDFSERYMQFREVLTEELARVTGQPASAHTEQVDDAFWGYVGTVLNRSYIRRFGPGYAQWGRSVDVTSRPSQVPRSERIKRLIRGLAEFLSSPRRFLKEIEALAAPVLDNSKSPTPDDLNNPRCPCSQDFQAAITVALQYPLGVPADSRG
jgi:glycosyltransferase domain-containing protein